MTVAVPHPRRAEQRPEQASGHDVPGDLGDGPQAGEEADLGTVSGLQLASALGLLVGLLGFLIGSRRISDNSFLTHFANGRLIWNGVGIPRVDPYSWSAAGEPVVVQSWLASWLYVAGHATFGDWSIRALNGLLAAGIAYGLWRLTDVVAQIVPRLALIGAGLVVAAGMWTPRPLLFGLLGFVWVLLAVERRVPLWSLLPVMWIWVQTHGSFPIAVALMGAIIVGQFFDDRSAGLKRIPRDELVVLAWVSAGIGLGALNPLGPRLLVFPVQLLNKSDALDNVREWSPPGFDRPSDWAFLGLALAAAFVGGTNVPWRRLLPMLSFVALGFIAVRNVSMAALVITWAIAPLVSVPQLSLTGRARGLLPKAIATSSVAVLLLVLVAMVGQPGFDLRKYPVDAVDWMEERALVANPDVRIAQRDTTGNYLELRYGSKASVFVDDRFDFYPLEVLADHDTFIFGGDYREVLDRNEIDVVLWAGTAGFPQWLDEADEWQVGYRDEDGGWLVACRAGSPAGARCR